MSRLNCKDTRTDFYALRSDWFKIIEFDDNGEYEFVPVGPVPELKEGEVMGYHIVIADGKFTRYFIALSEEESKKRKYQIPRVFSKYKAVSLLMQLGYWDACKQYIEDSGLYDLYLAANEFSETDEYFIQGLEQIKSSLGLTDEQVESILEKIVA